MKQLDWENVFCSQIPTNPVSLFILLAKKEAAVPGYLKAICFLDASWALFSRSNRIWLTATLVLSLVFQRYLRLFLVTAAQETRSCPRP